MEKVIVREILLHGDEVMRWDCPECYASNTNISWHHDWEGEVECPSCYEEFEYERESPV